MSGARERPSAFQLPFSRRVSETAGTRSSNPLDAYVFLSLAAAERSAVAAAELEARSLTPEIIAEGDPRIQDWRAMLEKNAQVELPRCYEKIWPRGLPEPREASVEIDYWAVAPASLRLSPLDVLEAADAWEQQHPD